MPNNPKIAVLGNGAWGSALFKVLKTNNLDVRLYGHEKVSADIIVLAVPTQAIRQALTQIDFSNNPIIVNTAKGIERESHLLPFEIIQEVLGKEIKYFSLIGPSFAEEVNKNMPTLVNLGFIKESSENNLLEKIFETDFFRVKLTKGVEVLELSGAFKNIYAIGCGIAGSLNYGINTRVKLIVLAIEEMEKLFKSLGFFQAFDSKPGTIGDLILTCSSIESRNFKFGIALTKYPTKEALKQVSGTVEGFYSLDSIPYFEKKANLKLPLADFLLNVVSSSDPRSIKQKFEEFVRHT